MLTAVCGTDHGSYSMLTAVSVVLITDHIHVDYSFCGTDHGSYSCLLQFLWY
jgi:hypothetical protein